MRFLCLLMMLTAALMQQLDAYLYQAIIMRRWNDLYDRYNYFIGLGDYHIKQHPANGQQRAQFEQLLAQADSTHLKLLTEDLSVSNIDGRFSCGKFYVNSRGGFLGGITEWCRDLGLESVNLEYRYARVCALGPILNHGHQDPHNFASVRDIPVGHLCKEIYYESDRIDSFDDGPVLNTWYRECTQMVDKKMQALSLPLCEHASMADYLSCTHKQRLPLVKKLLTFDCSLLDAKIVHEIVNSQDIERICALAGGSHIERVTSVLQKVGYKPIMQIKPIYQKNNALEQCLGLQNWSSNKMMPEPLSLDRLKNFF